MEARKTKQEIKEERREERKLEELRQMEEKKNSSSRMKWLVIGLASVLFLSFFVFAIVASKKKASAPIVISNSGNLLGKQDSKVTLAEFGDFQCPACGVFEPTFEQIAKDYSSKIKIVFKHFPLKQIHPNAMPAAIAAEAAAKQGKFWQYHNILYANQEEWSPLPDPRPKFIEYAKKLNLDVSKFTKDLDDKSITAKIDAQVDEGIKQGVNSTPSIFINGVLQENRSYNGLKSEIEKQLATQK